jgi:hypothetical protein
MIHKAEREKHKRDLLNDLFGELGEMLGELITNRVHHSIAPVSDPVSLFWGSFSFPCGYLEC